MQPSYREPVDQCKLRLKSHLTNDLNAGTDQIDIIAALGETLAETALAFLGPEVAIDLLRHLIERIENRPENHRSELAQPTGMRERDGGEAPGPSLTVEGQYDVQTESRRARILARASKVFGSRAVAKRWLEQPVMTPNQKRPIDLLVTPAGAEMLEEFLAALEHGINT